MVTLYNKVTRKPLTMQVRGDNVFVTPYRKPDQLASGIIIPEIARADRTQTLWEVVAASERACEALGYKLERGMLMKTVRRWPADTGLVTEDGYPVLAWPMGCRQCPEHPRGNALCGFRGLIDWSA